MNKIFFLTIFLMFSFSSKMSASETIKFPLHEMPQRSKNSKQLFMITMAKSGTHLLMKFWYLLLGLQPVDVYQFKNKKNFRSYPWTHFFFDQRILQKLLKKNDIQIVVNVRDPRDICVSIVDHLLNSPSSWLSFEEKEWFSQLSFDEQLFYVIEKDGSANSPRVCLEQVSFLIKDSRVVVCRFEDLVGPEGGGTKEKQIKQIGLLLEPFSISLSNEKIDLLADSLFGINVTDEYSSTYRSGQIGSWKECFTREHKQAFKEQMGDYLIELGYEEDYNW